MSERAMLVLGRLAIHHKFLTGEQVNECLDIQKKMRQFGAKGKRLGEIAVEQGYITDEKLEQLLKIQKDRISALINILKSELDAEAERAEE